MMSCVIFMSEVSIAGHRLTEGGQRQRAKLWRLVPPPNHSPLDSPHSPPDSLADESLKVKPGKDKQPMAAVESECGESSESKNRPLKFSASAATAEVEPAQRKSTEKRLLDSLDSLSAPLTPPKPSPAGDLEPSESNHTQTHQHSLNQAPHSPSKEVAEPLFYLVAAEEDLAPRLDEYLAAEVLALDLETTGLDPHTHRIRLVQMAIPDRPSMIVDLFQLPAGLRLLAPVFETPAVKVFHHAKFDLKFLFKQEVEIRGQIFDTMLAEQLLQAGIRGHSSRLGSLVASYLKQSLDKEQQSSDWAGDLTRAQLIYAAQDAQVLLSLKSQLTKSLLSKSLVEVAELEFDCVRTVAQMELAGLGLDAQKWQEYCQSLEEKVEIHAAKVRSHFPLWAQEQGQELNPNSTQQLQSALTSIGIAVDSTRKEVLKPLSHHPAVADLRQYKEWHQQSKYGPKIRQSIHPTTGRIHADYRQLGTETGRFSCSDPPLQQIPQRPQVRSCFVAAAGHKLVRADYSQIELRVTAQISRDQKMIEAYQQGQDLHQLTASLITDTTMDEVRPDQRQAAKAVNFGLFFGMGAEGLLNYARNTFEVEMSLSQAQQFRQRFFHSYQGFNTYYQQQNSSRTRQLSTLSGRIRRFSSDYASLTQKLNSPVQGTAADIIKRALVELTVELAATETQIVACIHDEIILEVVADQAESAKTTLERVMVEAGRHYLPDVPVAVEVTVADSWGGE